MEVPKGGVHSVRRFMPLSVGPPVKPTPRARFLNTSTPPVNLSGSFVVKPKEQPIKQLPDIFTTCPELRKFNMPIVLPPNDNSPNEYPQNDPYLTQPPPTWQIPAPQPLQSPLQKFDPNTTLIKPQELNFVPKSEWSSQAYTLVELRQVFFTRRNGIGRVFPVKLYHALLITKRYPGAYWCTGVCWITSTVFKVNAQIFAGLLGIHAVQGGLFHKQGNFSRHHYLQVMKQSSVEFDSMPECADVDDFAIRLFVDPEGRFTRDAEYELSSDPSLAGCLE